MINIKQQFAVPVISYIKEKNYQYANRELIKRHNNKIVNQDIPIETHIKNTLQWLCSAQDNSQTNDGGVARHYHIIEGWGASYPETTGYIIPTFINCAKLYQNDDLIQRAKKMLDWLVDIQFDNGAFQGGMINEQPKVPVVFNTGQILFGLVAGAKEFGEPYINAAQHAADWLCAVQDDDGCWRKHSSPFAAQGEKVYDTHVAWALLEAARIFPNSTYAQTALKNINWAITKQLSNGWFTECCLSHPEQPLTHTIGYALRGILEGYLYSNNHDLLKSCIKTADNICNIVSEDGFLAGRLDCNWQGSNKWSCLTGNVQIAYCLFKLFELTNNIEYFSVAKKLNAFTRSTQISDKLLIPFPGGIKGSHPIQAEYGEYQYLNWAAKFFIDSHLLELDLSKQANN